MDYLRLAKQVITYVGGENNIIRVEHCATRLRLHLQSLDKAEKEVLLTLEPVKGVIDNNNQLQLIIGTEAAKIYHAVQKELTHKHL